MYTMGKDKNLGERMNASERKNVSVAITNVKFNSGVYGVGNYICTNSFY